MSGSIRRLGVDELWRSLEHVDLVAVLAVALRDTTDRPRCAGLTPWPHDEDLLLFEDPVTGDRSLLPATELRTIRTGALVAVAAAELLDSATMTVGVLGAGRDAQGQVLVIATCLRNISHLAAAAVDEHGGPPFEQWVFDHLDLLGIGLDVVRHAGEAVYGADLVLAAGPGADGLRYAHLARGSVLVNTSDQRLPTDVVRGADRVYVDDARLLTGHPQLTADDARTGPGRVGGRRHVDSELRRMLPGQHPGVVALNEIALVEILDTGPTSPLDVPLAESVHWTVVGRE